MEYSESKNHLSQMNQDTTAILTMKPAQGHRDAP